MNTSFTNIKDMLRQSVINHKNKIVYKIKKGDKYQEIKYKDLAKFVESLGTSLIDLGLKNKRIGIISENRYEWEVAYLTIISGVGVVVPIDRSLPSLELLKVLEISQVDAIFCSKDYVEVLNSIKDKTNLKYIFSFDDRQFKRLIKKGNGLIRDGNKKFLKARVKKNDASVLLFTSGTTSTSKVVALSQNSLISNLLDLNKSFDFSSADVFLSILPLHHVFECTFGFLYPISIGATITFSSGLRHIAEDLSEYKVSVMASVPAIYKSLLKTIKKIEDKNINLLGGNIKLLLSGAACLDPNIENEYRKLGLNLMQGYGLTETAPFVSVCTNKNYRLGSVGKIVPSMKAKIINKNEEGIGELIVKGKNVMLGYFKDNKVVDSFTNGWFYTGDLAKIDSDGFLFICGRVKNTIVLNNGKNVYPEEIESLVNNIDGVRESLIFGRENKTSKDIKINVAIVPDTEVMKNNYHLLSKDEIYEYLSSEVKKINKIIPSYKSIKEVIIRDEPFIKTSTNKIKRVENILSIIN